MVIAPVSSTLHSLGIRLRRYLDDWLVQASSREAVLSSEECPLPLPRARYRREPGEIKFCSISTSSVPRDSHRLCVFQGFSFPSTSREASLNWRRNSCPPGCSPLPPGRFSSAFCPLSPIWFRVAASACGRFG